MKTTLIALMLLTLPFDLAAQDTYSDAAEYGFKGKVKSVRTTNYHEIEQLENGAYDLTDDKVFSIWTMFFDEEGRITRSIERFNMGSGEWFETITEIKFTNGRKSGYVKTDSTGQELESATYTWADAYNYELVSKNIGGAGMTSSTKLNERFREIGGSHTYYNGDLVFQSESYTNELDEQDRILATEYQDQLSDRQYRIEYRHKKFDERGNNTEVALIEPTTGMLVKVAVREFQYYE
jgi:hypothetical protein